MRPSLSFRFARFWCRHFDLQGLDVVLALVVGVLTAIAGICTHKLVHEIGRLTPWILKKSPCCGWLWILPLPLLGIALSYLVQRLVAGRNFIKSLSTLILKMDRQREDFHPLDMGSHIVTSSICIGLGGSAGQEAPGVLTGAAIGSNLARFFHIRRSGQNLLVGCGCAAALAAIFNCPVAGVLFVIEALFPEFSVSAIIPLLFSSAIAAVCTRIFTGSSVFFLANTIPIRPAELLPVFLCGIFCAIIGMLVIRTTYGCNTWMDRLAGKRDGQRILLGGGLLCIFLLLFPHLRAQGYGIIEQLLQGNLQILSTPPRLLSWCPPQLLPLLLILAAILLKAVVSALTISAGGDGGIFAPTMFIGAFAGLAFAKTVNATGILQVSEINFTALGMCGVFTAVMRSPLTGIFLIAETTGSYVLLVPLMLISSVSWFAGRFLEPDSVYRKILVQQKLITDDPTISSLRRHTAAECITPASLILHPEEDMLQVFDTIRRCHHREDLYPVLDEQRHLLGTITADHMMAAILNSGKTGDLRVWDIMEPALGSLQLDATLDTALTSMRRFHTHTLPVLHGDGTFAGLLLREKLLEQSRSNVI